MKVDFTDARPKRYARSYHGLKREVAFNFRPQRTVINDQVLTIEHENQATFIEACCTKDFVMRDWEIPKMET